MILMRCVKAKRWMSLQIDGSLSSDRVKKLERHIRQCVGCQAEWRMLARIHEALTAQPEEVAEDIYKAQQKNKNVLYTKWMWRWVMMMIKMIPEWKFKGMSL